MNDLTLRLDPTTHAWLVRQAEIAGVSCGEFLAQIARELAQPDAFDDALIDRVLAS